MRIATGSAVGPVNPVRRVALDLRRRWRAAWLSTWGDGLHWKRVPSGFWMRLSRDDFMDYCYYFHEIDHAFYRDAPRLVRPGESAIDLGANKGFNAMVLARALGPLGRVLAVEPDPAVAPVLAEHRERNGFPSIQIERVAVGERNGQVEIALSKQVGWTSRYPNPLQKRYISEMVTVPLRTVDSLVAACDPPLGPISFAKVDIEGSEGAALAGMRDTLANHGTTLWMEINATSLAAGGSSPAALDDILLPLGYRVFPMRWTSIEYFVRPRRIIYTEAKSIATHPGGELWDVLLVSPQYLDRIAPMLGGGQ